MTRCWGAACAWVDPRRRGRRPHGRTALTAAAGRVRCCACTDHATVTSIPVVLVHGWGGSFADDLGATGSPNCSPMPAARSSASTCSATARRPSRTTPRLRRPDRADRRRAARRAGRCRRLLARGDHAAAAGDAAARAVPPPGAGRASAATCSSATTSEASASSPASRARPSTDDNAARLFAQYAAQPGNDAVALAAMHAAARRAPVHRPRSWRRSRARCSSPSVTMTSAARPTCSSPRCPTPARRAAPHRPLRHAGVVRLHRRRRWSSSTRFRDDRAADLDATSTSPSNGCAPVVWWPSRPRPSTGSAPTPTNPTPRSPHLRRQGPPRPTTR